MPLRIVALGTYDTGKPRTRILLRGLRENGAEVYECHYPAWGDIEDKSQVQGLSAKLSIIGRMLLAYPILSWRYLRLPAHDVVFIGYLGLFDVLLLWPLARLRGTKLVWDVFLSLYNTVVEDRGMINKRHPAAVLLWAMEWLALRLVDLALMDTRAHARYLGDTYNCRPGKVVPVFVGAEPEAFDLKSRGLTTAIPDERPLRVLFYGQFIPLHGIETVVRAAKLTETQNTHWVMIGKGQEADRIRALVDELQPDNLEWIDWVPYEQLVNNLARCHVALGIFGTSEKAARVIPNKVYQILTAGRPLITGDTPAARELLHESNCVTLVPVGSPQALAKAILQVREWKQVDCINKPLLQQFSPSTIGAVLLGYMMALYQR